MTIADIPNTRFRDVFQSEVRERDALDSRRNQLLEIQKKRGLSKSEQAELTRIESIQKALDAGKPFEMCDPLFVATRALLNDKILTDPKLKAHIQGGKLEFEYAALAGAAAPAAAAAAAGPGAAAQPAGGGKRKNAAFGQGPDYALVALTLGLLTLDAAQPPAVIPRNNNTTIEPDRTDRNWDGFVKAFYAAVGEAQTDGVLSTNVLAILADEGDPDGRARGRNPTVSAEEFARVMRRLQTVKGIEDDPQLRRRVNEALNVVQNVGGQDRIADLSIDLPDLEEIFDQNIVSENVRAMGPMIVAAMFEELKVFQVVDRIVEQFQQGTLPIGPGNAGRLLYRYWREAPNRLSEQERRNFASTTLGIPGGDPTAMVNREFNDLWIRFVSSVSSFVRQHEVESLLRSALPSPISHQQVRKSARDLAANLSLHGYGMAHYAARELQDQIGFMIDLLQDPEIRGAYGARDMWQVVDQVATYDLGGARTSSRYRTLATCGTIITAWLAKNVNRINRTTGPLIDINQVRNPDLSPQRKATRDPSDYDLVNACELWLADTATSDTQVEEMSQPREAPQMTSKPIPIPALARDMLEGLGDLGVGLGAGNGHARSFARQ